jgi:hypothetical protein
MHHNYGMNEFLQYSILIFSGLSVLFLILLLISRLKNIYKEKVTARYTPVIENMLFPLIFENLPVDSIIHSNEYKEYITRYYFKKLLLQNIINLHESYTGIYNLKLEEFYRSSGLIQTSLSKLNSGRWHIKCRGIRELSEMKVHEAYEKIRASVRHKNSTLKLEALSGVIRLKGLEGLNILNDYKEPVNDWVQANILYEIENANLTGVKDFSYLLTSENETVVILGLRLIAKFNQIENIDKVREIQNANASYRISNQALKTLAKLPASAIYNPAKP